MKRLALGLLVAGLLALIVIRVTQADSGICPLICPWSPLCVPPICDPSGGGGSGSGA